MNPINYLAFAMLTFFFIGCNRDQEPKTDTSPQTPSIDWSLSTQNNLSNLQVNDRISIDFEIRDQDTARAVYILKPETQNAVFHQKIGIDYKLQTHLSNEDGDQYNDVQQIELTSKNLRGKFYIKILKPGNFQHKYTLEKYVNNQKINEKSIDFSFNAVEIIAWTYSVRIKAPGFFNHSEHRRFWKFVIHDGIERFDHYLTSNNGKTHTYAALYKGHWHTDGDGSFSAETEKQFRFHEDREVSPVPVTSYNLDQINIRQVQPDGTINNIVYKNIPIHIK